MKLRSSAPIAALAIIFAFGSCSLFGKPSGSAEIASVVTSQTDTASSCTVYVKISNTGNKAIYESTISLRAQTNLHTYYKSSVCSICILPDEDAYTSVGFEFESSTETYAEGSASIVGQFYN